MRKRAKRDEHSASVPHGARLERFGYVGPRVKAQQAEIRRILRTTGAQARLTIGQPNDKYEQEADRVADQVMTMPDPRLQRQPENQEEEETFQTKPLADQATPLMQRQEAPPEEEEEPMQAKSKANVTSTVTSGLESRIHSMKEGGQPLDPATRAFFEPRFGRDFSQVKVHSDSAAADTAKSINARALTLGNHVAMGAGEYHPNSQSGQRLLGHELTHVIQQGGGQTQNKSEYANSIASSPIEVHPVTGTVQRRRRRRRRRYFGPPPSTVEVTKAINAAKATLAKSAPDIKSKITKQRKLENHFRILHGLRRRLLYIRGRSRDEQRLYKMREKVKKFSNRLHGKVFRSKEFKAIRTKERAAKRRAQRLYIQQLAKRYPVPLIKRTVAADRLMATAWGIKLPSATSATGRVLGKMTHRRALSKLIMAHTPYPTVTPAELAIHRRVARSDHRKTRMALIAITGVRTRLTVVAKKLLAEHQGLHKLKQNTSMRSLRHIPKAERLLILNTTSSRIRALLKLWKWTGKRLRMANRQWKQATKAEKSARLALNPASKQAKQAILERRLRKMGRRSVAYLEARAVRALKGKFAPWAVSVMVKYAGIPWGDASKWGGKHPYSQRWRLKQIPRTLASLVTLIKIVTGNNRRLRRRLITMLKRYPRVVQATCDQISELLLRARGFKLGWGNLGLTGQARWFLKTAAAARAGRVAHFKLFTAISDAPVGSVLFFPKWTAKAGRWQIAVSHPNFKPVMKGFNLGSAWNFPVVGEKRLPPVTHNGFEYWHVTRGTLSILDPANGGALLYKRYRHLKNLGFWVRFPIGNYKAPQVFRWKHVSTVIKIRGGKLVCFESGWKPSYAHITPGKSVKFLKSRNAFVGYVSGP